MNSLDNCINFLLTGAQHVVFQYMKKNLSQFDITPIQYGVLGCIWEFDMHNPKEIAAHLGVENSTNGKQGPDPQNDRQHGPQVHPH